MRLQIQQGFNPILSTQRHFNFVDVNRFRLNGGKSFTSTRLPVNILKLNIDHKWLLTFTNNFIVAIFNVLEIAQGFVR